MACDECAAPSLHSQGSNGPSALQHAPLFLIFSGGSSGFSSKRIAPWRTGAASHGAIQALHVWSHHCTVCKARQRTCRSLAMGTMASLFWSMTVMNTPPPVGSF